MEMSNINYLLEALLSREQANYALHPVLPISRQLEGRGLLFYIDNTM